MRYLIAGTEKGLSADQLTQLYRQRYPQLSRLWDRLKFLGMVSRHELARLYRIADIALVPSIYEPFGYAAVEAMAAGVPVIASDVGGLAEIISHGWTGLLIPVHSGGNGTRYVDVKKLTEAQIFLLNNDAIAKQISRAGKQKVLNEFTREQMVDSTRAVYSKVCPPLSFKANCVPVR